jgi:hypothetical protein
VTKVRGVPEIVGGGSAAAGGAVTWIENGASLAVERSLLTLMMMFESVPSFATAGVPLNVPFELLKPAQAGLFRILNFSVLDPDSEVVGVKL